MESNLEALLTPQTTNAQTAAIAMQQKYEEILLDDNNLMRMACKGIYCKLLFFYKKLKSRLKFDMIFKKKFTQLLIIFPFFCK